MHTKAIIFMGQPAVLACDGKCALAWGISNRPRQRFGYDPDDFAFFSDGEVDTPAPADPGTYEGGHAKPSSPTGINKWCARECERSDIASSAEGISLPDYSARLFNQPWKHAAAQPATAPAQQAADHIPARGNMVDQATASKEQP